MRKRRMSRRSSKRTFRNGARRTNAKNNYDAYNMRGGIRL